MKQQSFAAERVNFIEQLHQEFMVQIGYGAFVYLTSYGAVMLFNQYLQQPASEKEFIKAIVQSFIRSG